MAYLDYDLLSDCYDELYGEEQREKYRRVLSLCSSSLGIILDAGCGTGLFLDYLRGDKGHSYILYVGIDTSAGMLRIARRRKDSTSDFIQADIHHLPFRDNTFNTTLSITVIHHLKHVKALRELKRVTKGLVIVTQRKGLDNRILVGTKLELDKENIYLINNLEG